MDTHKGCSHSYHILEGIFFHQSIRDRAIKINSAVEKVFKNEMLRDKAKQSLVCKVKLITGLIRLSLVIAVAFRSG